MKRKTKIYIFLTVSLITVMLVTLYNFEAVEKIYMEILHKNGIIGRVNSNGKFDGEIDTYVNGIVTQKTNYANGLPDGWKVVYYPEGEIKSKELLHNGKYDGPKIMYYKNGQIEQSSFRKNDKVEGSDYSYYENGRVKYKRNWVNNKLYGSQYYYYENQKVKIYHAYDILGEKFYLSFYDETGKLSRADGETFSSNIYSINIAQDSLMVLKNNNKYDNIRDLYITDANPPHASTAVKVIINNKPCKNITFLDNNTLKIANAFPQKGAYIIVVDVGFVNKSKIITEGIKAELTIVRSQ